MQRRLPDTVLSYIHLYSRWLGQFSRGARTARCGPSCAASSDSSGSSGADRRLLSARYCSRIIMRYFPAAHQWKGAVHSVLWVTALLAAMPVYLSAYRKLKALA